MEYKDLQITANLLTRAKTKTLSSFFGEIESDVSIMGTKNE